MHCHNELKFGQLLECFYSSGNPAKEPFEKNEVTMWWALNKILGHF